MLTNNSGYTKLSRIIIVSFIAVFLIFSIFTYFLIQKNISDETKAAMMQAKSIQQSQVSVDSIQRILSSSPHLKVEQFYGRLNGDVFEQIGQGQANQVMDEIQPIVMPLSENSYLIISPDNEMEFAQNMMFFYLVAALFIVTLALLLIIIRLGIAHQLKPLRELAKALQHTLKDDQVDTHCTVVLPNSELPEIQAVFDQYLLLKQSLVNNELALLEADKQLAMLQEQERSYLARELHDNVGQLITSTKAYAHMLINTENKQVIKDSSIKIKAFCTQIGDAIRELTHHLHPIILDKVTLWEAVERLILDQQEITEQIKWHINIDCENFVGKKERDIHLYRIIQESINNIIKHSEARNATLNANMNSDVLHLEIIDDGVGLNDEPQKLGLGLSTIKTRARCIDANLIFAAEHGRGTKLTIKVNIQNEDDFS